MIAIEGIDGAGKTTQAHHVQNALQARKLPVLRCKEPTTGKWGQILRDSALTGRLSLEDEVETFIKDRQEHVQAVLLPALREGKVVIVDRYYFSNMAYQGARGFDPLEIQRRNEAFAPEPDLLILMDIEPDAGLLRIHKRGDRANLFESTNALHKAREIFLNIRKPYLYTIDASLEVSAICRQIVDEFTQRMMERIVPLISDPQAALDATLKLHGKVS